MLFRAQRLFISEGFSKAFFHGHARIESSSSSSSHSSPASTLWFIKVVSTICIQHSHSLLVFNSDYFRQNLNPFVAFGVICHINSTLNKPTLAFNFFRFSRINLSLIHFEPTFDLLLRSLCRMGLHDSARLVYEDMKADGFLPNDSVFDILVSSFANAGEFRTAQEILIAKAEMCNERGEKLNSFLYNKILNLLISRCHVDEAFLFFRDHMLRLRSICPDTCSFNIVVRGLCRVGKVDKAFEFFDVMRNFGCHPDIIMYNTLIYGLCRVGNVDRAHELLREVQAMSEVSPDVVTYTTVISGFCKLGKMEEAVTLLDNMITFGVRPNLFTFNVVIDGFGKKGEVAMALKMYERMIGTGFYPDVVTFTTLIDSHCRLGEVDLCMKLWDAMKERKVSPNVFTFSVLINALCKENRINEARELLNQLNWRDDIIPPPFIYNPVIDGYCKSGNVDEANAIVAEMEAKGCVHDKMTFTILILGHCMKGRMLEAIGIYTKMLSLGCAPDTITINALVSRLRKAGMAREANEVERNASDSLHKVVSSQEKTTRFRTNMNIPVAV